MNPKLKKYLKIILLSSVTLFFLLLAYRGNNFGELFDELKNANYIYALVGAFVGIVIGGYFRALRWRYFLNPLKKDIGMDILFSSMMVGYMMNTIIPRTGEVYRPVLLANKEKISKASAFGTILVERVFDVLNMLIVFGICLYFFKQKLSSAFAQYNLEAISIYASIIILVFVVIIVLIIFNFEKSEIIIEKISQKLLPKRFQERIHNLLLSLVNGFLFIKYPKYYFQIIVLTVLIWMSYVFSTYITSFAFNINLSLFDANLVLTMITFAQTIPLPANSAGLYHLFCTATLVNIFGVNRETAFGYATVSHLLGSLGLILLGAFYFFKENLNLKTSKVENSDAV